MDGLRFYERFVGYVLSVDVKVVKNKGIRKGIINVVLLRLEKDIVVKMEKLFNIVNYVCYFKMFFFSFFYLCFF